MKLLWVKSGGFLPLDTGGKIRSYQLLKQLASRHDVSVFTFYPEQRDDQHAELRSFCSRVELQPLHLPERASLRDMVAYAANVLSPFPYSMVKYCRPAVRDRLGQLLSKERYDAIICDFLLTSAVIPWDIPCPKVLFTHNVEAVIWERHWRVSRNPLWKMISWREYRTVASMERKYLQQADSVLTVSDADRQVFSSTVSPDKITTIPTGVDVDYFAPGGQKQPEADTLVFTGSMDWLPNEDAIVYFAEKILPLIQEQRPATRLLVVGRRPTAKLQALALRNRPIQITGAVEDIRPYVQKSAVYVVPLRIGGGTRIKIFEAMAMGKAVVSTSIGAEGLPVTDRENILLADTPANFAADVVRLLTQVDERRRLGLRARQLVETHYSWAVVTDVLESALARTISEYQRSKNPKSSTESASELIAARP